MSAAHAAVFAPNPFGTSREWKQSVFRDRIMALVDHHYERCPPYRHMLTAMDFVPSCDAELKDVPFLPTGLFKRHVLASVPPSEVAHVMRSSGTGGQDASSVYLDRRTSLLQMRALTKIVAALVGRSRLPLLVVDAPHVLTLGLAARGVAIQGFSVFGTHRAFALTPEMEPDVAEIERFLAVAGSAPFLVFGMTSIIWERFVRGLEELGPRVDFSNAILIHGGGWKHLSGAGVTETMFRDALLRLTGAARVHDYYGMAEQGGSIFLQCPGGFLHCSSFSEVFVRRPGNFSLCDVGEPGILQTMSCLPESYPGHSLLTHDEGIVCGEDDCECGWGGTYFTVTRRLPEAEPKGCGDAVALHA